MKQPYLPFRCTILILQVLQILAQQSPNDIVRSGPYAIQLCGNKAPQLQTALQRLWTALQPAIEDTKSITPNGAFRAFFKTPRRSPFVRRVLTDIANGTKLPSIADPVPSAPKIVCVTGPDLVRFSVKGEIHDVYNDCRRNPLWASAYYSGVNYIFLCNLFFSPGNPAKPKGICPTVDAETNRFVGDLNALIQFRPYVLLHELAHFYVVPPSTENTQYEVYDWNDAFMLKAKRAILNAQSYVLYVASVAAGCRSFPSLAVPHSRGRRLGEGTYAADFGRIDGLWANGSATHNDTSLWLGNVRVL